ncbi:glycosyltransferase family 2 protein [Mucilaginibacter gynuensis]|uniref:Glycosyltransferase family 2 protein n=1 Tax=Mucilaginibacter gynuensis TaxID=1302236 RepID=A0ABP8GNL0_9SPHI
MATISIIIPAFNEASNIGALLISLFKVLQPIRHEFEVIIINDGSTDNTAAIVAELALSYGNLYLIDFSRNFGQQKALRAGYDHAKGDAVICIDADLQNPPELIADMIEKWENGYEVVLCKRRKGKQQAGYFKEITSRLFYKTLNLMAEGNIDADTPDFRLIDRKLVEIIKYLPEKDVFLRGLISWMGFNKIVLEYDHGKRLNGKTGYSPIKMLRLALTGITGFSAKPLHFAIYMGLGISILSLFYIPYILVRYFSGETISGWSSLIITITFMGGLQLFILGILGLYLGKLFMHAKNRPDYIIRENTYKPALINQLSIKKGA